MGLHSCSALPTGVSGPWWVEAGKGAHAVTIGEPILPRRVCVSCDGQHEDPTARRVFTYSAWPMAQTLVVKVHNEEGAGDLTCEVLDPAGNVIAVSHGADFSRTTSVWSRFHEGVTSQFVCVPRVLEGPYASFASSEPSHMTTSRHNASMTLPRRNGRLASWRSQLRPPGIMMRPPLRSCGE